jgi:hypothetical protein
VAFGSASRQEKELREKRPARAPRLAFAGAHAMPRLAIEQPPRWAPEA